MANIVDASSAIAVIHSLDIVSAHYEGFVVSMSPMKVLNREVSSEEY
jgi:hypothetical protein